MTEREARLRLLNCIAQYVDEDTAADLLDDLSTEREAWWVWVFEGGAES